MPKSVEGSNHGIPKPPDTKAWRHFGDGFAGELIAARLQGYSTALLDYVDLAVDQNGVLQIAGGGGGGTAMADNAAFTVGTTSITTVGGTYKSVRSALTDNSAGAVALNAKRGIYATLETPLSASVMDEANTAVRVNIVAGAGSGGTALADKAAFTEGATSFTPGGGVFNETITADPTEDQAAAFRITAKRGLHTNLRTAAGVELLGQTTMAGSVPVAIASNQAAIPITDNAGSLTVDGAVAATQSGAWTVTASHDVTGIADGRKVVATAGTREALAASTVCKRVDIQAELDNTGVVAVGGTTVVAALATRRGVALNAGETYSLEIDNLADINLDVTVNGDGVTYAYFT